MKHVIFYGILLTVINIGFTSCEKETYSNETNATQYAKEEGEQDEFAEYIRGTISDTSNVVLDNATVSLTYQNSVYASTTSDTNGFYEFTRIPVGQYILKAQKVGYLTQSLTINLIEDQQLIQDFQLITE